MLTSTIFRVTGMTNDADVRAVIGKVYLVPEVGGAAVELENAGASRLIIKHKDDVTLDREAIAGALRKAGNFALADEAGA